MYSIIVCHSLNKSKIIPRLASKIKVGTRVASNLGIKSNV